MADVVDLAGERSKKAAIPSPVLIDFLGRLLDLAKEGQIQQVAAVWVDVNGIVGDGYSPGGHANELYPIIGGLEVCKATLVDGMRGSGP